MILSRDLYVTYKWRQDPVLKGINCSFNRKSLILGPNGSGKTTFSRAICALTNIKSGKILIDNRAIEDIYATKGILATNFQEVFSLIGELLQQLLKNGKILNALLRVSGRKLVLKQRALM
jgi:ABC-type cobalamin/Fe3+-siderophores transport system ATPase subunit